MRPGSLESLQKGGLTFGAWPGPGSVQRPGTAARFLSGPERPRPRQGRPHGPRPHQATGHQAPPGYPRGTPAPAANIHQATRDPAPPTLPTLPGIPPALGTLPACPRCPPSHLPTRDRPSSDHQRPRPEIISQGSSYSRPEIISGNRRRPLERPGRPAGLASGHL